MIPEKNVKLATSQFRIPLQVCNALNKDEYKIKKLSELLTDSVEQDLSHEKSFLLTRYAKYRNINPVTGADIDPEIPYYYKSELLSSRSRRIQAIAKVLCGLTGSITAFNEFGVDKLPHSSVVILAKFIQEKLEKAIVRAQFDNAISLLDKNHISDLSRGVFYIAPGVKRIEDMRGLRYLQVNKVIIPAGTTVIRSHAFENVPLEQVVLPKTISRIEDYAFRGCKLKSLSLPNNKYLKRLGVEAFSSNQIISLTIPDNFRLFDFKWFERNPLKTVSVPPTIKTYNRIPEIEICKRENRVQNAHTEQKGELSQLSKEHVVCRRTKLDF